MRLLNLLNALHKEIESARNDTSLNIDAHYNSLTARYLELSKYSLGDDVYTPGVPLSEIKRTLKASNNTYWSIFSALSDQDLSRAAYNRQLGILAVQVLELSQTVEAAYSKSTLISAATGSNISSETVAVAVEAAVSDTQIMQALREANEDISKAMKDIDQADKQVDQFDIEFLRKHQAAPATPEGYQALQNKSSGDLEGAKTEHTQDESQRVVLQQFQKGLQQLKETTVSPNSDWVVGKGPIFFTSTPSIKEFQIKNLKCKYSPFYPGWILADQFLLGIKPSLIKDRKALMETLNHIQAALSQRFPGGFVYMAVPHVNMGYRSPTEGLNPEELSTQQLKKSFEKVRKAEETKTGIPKFTGLPGSRLLWTWMLPVAKRNTLENIKINEFGFPIASSMRNLDERLTKSIIPELKEEGTKVDDLLKQYRIKIEEEYEKQSKPLKEKLADAKQKGDATKDTIKDLETQFAGAKIALAEMTQELSLAATSALQNKLKASIKAQEDRISVLGGKVNGHKAIAKALATETTSLKAQMAALISSIRQEAAANLEKARKGISPGDEYVLPKKD